MLRVSPATLKTIADHAAEGYPEEVCGLLVGQLEGSGSVRAVAEAHRVANTRADRRSDRFELDPKSHLRIQKAARQAGLRIVGVYHSHPDAEAIPSETDLARARDIWGEGPSWSYLIVSAGPQGAYAKRSWILANGTFEEESIELDTE
jgi:proteasome lid subunit RPN8/RPN11